MGHGWRNGDGKRRCFRREQLRPDLELVPDVSRGEERLAAEAALIMIAGKALPVDVEVRAISTLTLLAGA